MPDSPQIRRIKKLPLAFGTNPVDDTRPYLAAAAQLAGHTLQERVPHAGLERPSGRHHGVEFGIG